MTAVGVAVLLVASPALTGCTDDQAPRTSPGSPTPVPTATEAAPELQERAAPYQVRFGKVAGQVPRRKRERVLESIARPVRRWVEAGFVGGSWPRERFREAFVPFGQGIAERARKDADLLTLQALASSLTEVVPQRRSIVVSATTVGGRVVGATARLKLRVLGLEESGSRRRVNLRGEVYLTPTRRHGWQIFGYDVARWVEGGGR